MWSKLEQIIARNGEVFLLTILAFAQFSWLYSLPGISLRLAITDAVVSYLLLYGLFFFIKYAKRSVYYFGSGYLVIGAQSLVLAILWVYGCYFVMIAAMPKEKGYALLWQSSYFVRGLIAWIVLSAYAQINALQEKVAFLEKSKAEEQLAENLKKEAELYKLRQQIQPHFLFNSLNSINALIGREPKDARRMVQQLSDYLRNTIKKDDESFVSFRNELDDLRLYLEIERVRFGHRLLVDIQEEGDDETVFIPPFLLQPLMENAIKYGLYGTIGKVEIGVEIQKTPSYLIFSISNPYDVDAVTVRGTGFGLKSIYRRLYLIFGRNDLLHVRHEPGFREDDKTHTAPSRFIAVLKIPLIR